MSQDCSGHGPPCRRNGTPLPLCPEEHRYRVPGPKSRQCERPGGLRGGFPSCLPLHKGARAAGLSQPQLGSRGGWLRAPSRPTGQAHPSHAASCEWDSTRWHGVNTWAVWGGSTHLAAFRKDEKFTSRAVGPLKGVRRLTFHPCFFTPAFSLPLSRCGVSSNCFAPPQRQLWHLQWVSNCYRDHLQSFGILLPPQARLMDGDSLTLSTLSSPPSEMKTVGTSVAAAQHLAELSFLPGGRVFQRHLSRWQ